MCSYVLLCVPLSVCLDIFGYFYMFRYVEGLYQKLPELYTLRSKYEGHVLARDWLWQHVRRSQNFSSAIHWHAYGSHRAKDCCRCQIELVVKSILITSFASGSHITAQSFIYLRIKRKKHET